MHTILRLTAKRRKTWANSGDLIMSLDLSRVTSVGPGAAEGAMAAMSSLLAERDADRATCENRLALLCDAFLSEHDEARRSILLQMRQRGAAFDDIVDVAIPEVARFMGRRWAEDGVSFADVTIVAARLQETVRLIGLKRDIPCASHAPEITGGRARRRILLVIPKTEHHTLGTFVLADQFRRHGHPVEIAIDLHPREIARKVRMERYAMMGISAAGRRTLASARELVDMVRASATHVTPIVLGGSIVAEGADLKRTTGVDHVVRDVESALRVCRLDKIEGDLTHVAS